MSRSGTIRAGIGGWAFKPWDETFYPSDLTKKRQLEYASRQLRAIEVNGTYYGSQKPATFAKWRAETPDGFIFSLKASRYCTNRKILAEAGPSIEKFLTQGLTELGDRLGPILWQFAPTKVFDPEDFSAFLKLLPKEQDGIALRHAVEPRHDSFCTPEFIEMLAEYGAAAVVADHASYPMFADVTADFVYARLQTGSDDITTCYPLDEIERWAERFQIYADGGMPDDLGVIARDRKIEQKPRDVFAFFISGGKVNAPAGARTLQSAIAR
ncbi:hypothetical protein B7H23_13010 [Notoacmeibacter marinus]|uniref:DUF72 domain-containing protein n=1 Tax=Notoacmeibacter marinus TaxID=1876515 RepID=A0A231UT52_9HYPH|nr:DUF72 domain-containing protein [Notoacmeibacter marinus]OXS99118.1 hypothetical protein B7H23_13010 [Notoacmeibacter marinus]